MKDRIFPNAQYKRHVYCAFLLNVNFKQKESSKINRLLLRRTLLVLLLNIVIVIVFTTRKQEDVLADENEYSFHLPSIFKHDNDLHSKEVLFTAKYPGTINVNVSWEPAERKLTVTLYDQNGQSLGKQERRESS